MVRSSPDRPQLAIYSRHSHQASSDCRPSSPCVTVYAKKLLSVDNAAPKESPKDYAIPKEPLKELFNNQTKYRSKPKPEEKKLFRIQLE